MENDKSIFRIEKELEERIRNRYREFRTDGTEFGFGPTKIQVQSKLYEGYLNISGDEAKKVFKILCEAFARICHRFNLALDPLNILILTDDEIKRGFQAIIEEENGSLCGLIFIAQDYLRTHSFWIYTFLHELGHCWLGVKRPNSDSDLLPTYEVLVDLIAICSLKEIIPIHKKLFKDIVKYCSYFGREKNFNNKILENPESVLKDFLEKSVERR